MAGRRRHPTVPEQVLAGLLSCRDVGLDFDDAWDLVVGHPGIPGRRGLVRFPHNTLHRRQWREALAATRDEWAACYDRQPSKLSVALNQFDDVVDLSREAIPLGWLRFGTSSPLGLARLGRAGRPPRAIEEVAA
jgi:hypothetical protein